jgi:hypothetical protein
MTETHLWNGLRIHLPPSFQKLSDRFTLGVPDVIGCYNSVGYAFELKRSKRKNSFLVSYRPNQVPWLRRWADQGGVAVTLVTLGSAVWCFGMRDAEALVAGLELDDADPIFVAASPKVAATELLYLAADLAADSHRV